LVLAAVVLAFDHDAARNVRDAYRRIGLVDVLAASARGAEGVDAQVGRVDVHILHLVGFRHHGHGAGRSVDATLGFGGGHALHAMAARLELEPRISTMPDDARDHLAIAAKLRFGGRDDLDLPAVALGKA